MTGYGARGQSEAMLQYTWTKLWDTHAYNLCSHMPRFGAQGILTEQQLKDVMAYLLDPASPVNQAASDSLSPMHRREFHKLLGLGAAAGCLPSLPRAQPPSGDRYHLPRFGNVHLMHMTDVHGQLLPVHYREPSVNIGVHDARNRPPHLVGEALLNHFDIAPGSQAAHALSHLDYVAAAEQFGRAGGFATSPPGQTAAGRSTGRAAT